MTVTEAELLKLAQEGDYDAYEALYIALEPGLARFVRRLIGDGYETQRESCEARETVDREVDQGISTGKQAEFPRLLPFVTFCLKKSAVFRLKTPKVTSCYHYVTAVSR